MPKSDIVVLTKPTARRTGKPTPKSSGGDLALIRSRHGGEMK
ncbi:hypothetical protein I549_3784 [Mycobacterium avium subsp. avium 2285 (R)]|jgi:hypothetical protein|nr:hypothetical protein I549_3784 [Mycobacterium avium subsp. avium 2285 (R)]